MKTIIASVALLSAIGLSGCSPSQLANISTAANLGCVIGKSVLQKNGVTVGQCKKLGGAAIAIAADAADSTVTTPAAVVPPAQ